MVRGGSVVVVNLLKMSPGNMLTIYLGILCNFW